jgi:hypothetical protein
VRVAWIFREGVVQQAGLGPVHELEEADAMPSPPNSLFSLLANVTKTVPRHTVLVLFLWCGLTSHVFGAEGGLTGFFTGALGKDLNVVFSLREQGGRITGFYYYPKIGQDIPITGVIDQRGSFTLKEYGEKGTVTGIWQGRMSEADQLTGAWKSPRGNKTLSFALQRLHSDEAPGEAEHREIFQQGIGYRKAPVGKTGVQFPKLTHYPDQAIVQKVNAAIKRLTDTMGCQGEGDYDVRSAVTYAEKDIFSIYASASYDCGGAYPTNDANLSVTFDLKTGEVVRFSDLFRDYEANKRKIVRTIFAQQVARSEQVMAERGQENEAQSGDCDSDPSLFSLDHLVDSSLAFHFAADGLHVQPQWPHAIEACAETVTVPYNVLQEFSASQSILTRILSSK